MFNPYQKSAKKYLFEILEDRYTDNTNFIDRISAYLVTENDIKELARFIADVYEAGYLRAAKQYKENLEKMGYSVAIVPDSKKKME